MTSKYALPRARALCRALAVSLGLLTGASSQSAAGPDPAAPASVSAATEPAVEDNSAILDARDALRARDKLRLAAARDVLIAARHPLAPWADYWWIQLRLADLSVHEMDEFLSRWPDTYVADRARNDWLLELGRRQDWRTFLRIQPTFRMNDDREVTCLGILARHQTNAFMEGPGDLREQARQSWWGQKDADYGCDAMARGLLAGGILDQADVWRKLRLAVENDRARAVTQSAKLLGDNLAQAVSRALGQPHLFLAPRVGTAGDIASSRVYAAANRGNQQSPGEAIGPTPKPQRERFRLRRKGKPRPNLTPIPASIPPEAEAPLNLLAFIRWANLDPGAAAAAIAQPESRERWKWGVEETAWAWAQLGRAAAWRLMPEASTYFDRAMADRALAASTGELRGLSRSGNAWSPETLAWMARAAVKAAVTGQPDRWALVEQAIDAMAPDQQQDSAWLYWRAKALQARSKTAPSAAGTAATPGVSAGSAGSAEALRQQARDLLARAANPLTFYGQLAAEELNAAPARAPARPVPPTEAEAAQARAMPGIDRALRLLDLGWRGEAVREWNYTLTYGKPGGLSDRELLAVADEACRREVWDRCINSSERTRQEVDLAQRYPTPFRNDVLAAAREVGLDPAFMYGLIRQESRFILAARSNVGASGLMQVMPATAAWTANKLGIGYHPDQINDRMTNLRIGAGYLKLVLDDFQGMQPLAAAAYNAGPGRPRRWRDGPRIDAAAWVENIPFNETRDYVKRVLANATVYGHLLQGRPLSLKGRLGNTIAPRSASAPPPEADLP